MLAVPQIEEIEYASENIKRDLELHVSNIFEVICQKAVYNLKIEDKFIITGSWWDNNEEIDVLVGKEKGFSEFTKIETLDERIPKELVGKIISGNGSFDESTLTGESIPIYKKVKDFVYSGTINLDSLIQFEVTKSFKNSTFSSIVALLEDSLNSKPTIQTKAAEISKGFRNFA